MMEKNRVKFSFNYVFPYPESFRIYPPNPRHTDFFREIPTGEQRNS